MLLTSYDGLACNTFRLNRTETSSTEQQIENPDQYMAVNMTGPDNVGFYEVTSEKRYTPDNNTSFWIDEGTVLLVSLTGSHAGTAVISLTALNNIEREAIRHSIPLSEGSFAQPVYFYSIEQHPNSITPNNNRRITVGEVNGRKYVTMKKSGSSMEGVFEVTYYGESTFNNEIIINKYSENTEIDIVKVTNDTLDQETKTPLEDAVFQITQLNEQSTASHVFYLTKTEGGTQVPVYQRTTDPTDSDGKASFTGLSSGYYEIKEIASPGGYILLGDVIYVHINHGTVTYLKKPETETDPDKPIAEWESITSGVNVRFEAAQEATQTTEASNATFTIGNEPGAALPSTGGSGTRLFTSLGSILILGAGVLLWRRRRLI